jgi:di/tricarboxylate transporter
MGIDAWLALGVTVVLFIALVRNIAPPDVLFLSATAFLAVCGIITPAQAFSGFSNPGVLTVAALFVVAAGLRETGVLDHLGHRVLGRVTEEGVALGRIAGLVIPLSAFLNNTPIVAMLMPIVMDWCRRHRISPSKLLIPMSYLAILGGTCTLIGTSTNLVVHGLMIKTYQNLPPAASAADSAVAQNFREGLQGLGLFEIAAVGIPYAIIGIIYLYTVGRWILPERKELLEQLGETRREYLVEMSVEPDCRLVGQSIETAGLRHLPGLFLIEIDRNGTVLAPASPEEVIRAGDRLVFTGIVSSIVELEKIPGLVPAADPDYQVSARRQRNRLMSEAVISSTSPLVGKTVREADFRAMYNAAVVAVHRNGARLTNKVGDIELHPGDTLLLQTRPHFVRAHRNNPDFYLVSDVDDWRPLRRDRAILAVSVFAALIVTMTTGIGDIAVGAVMAAVLMVLLGCISAGDARTSIEWQVLITIAAAFGIGIALQNTGAATFVAGSLVELTQHWGKLATLACIYLLGSVITAMITNNAAAVLLFPFCVETARLMEVSPRPFLIALVLAASASFVTPIGYQTNMMVYGPGGYRFIDFVKIGLPLNLILWITAVLLIPLFWSW